MSFTNDILAFFESKEQHHRNLKKVLSILEENNLQISVDKCQFYKDHRLLLDISTERLKPTTQKVEDIKKLPEPTDSKSLCRFLRMVNFYMNLIPQAADVLLPLT